MELGAKGVLNEVDTIPCLSDSTCGISVAHLNENLAVTSITLLHMASSYEPPSLTAGMPLTQCSDSEHFYKISSGCKKRPCKNLYGVL